MEEQQFSFGEIGEVLLDSEEILPIPTIDELTEIIPNSCFVPEEGEEQEGPCPTPLQGQPPEEQQQPLQVQCHNQHQKRLLIQPQPQQQHSQQAQQQQQQSHQLEQQLQPLEISITNRNKKPDGNCHPLKVLKDYSFNIKNMIKNETFFVIIRRVEQFSVVPIFGEKRNGEDDGCEPWPFTVKVQLGNVSRQKVEIPGDAVHFGYKVVFNDNNEAIINISRITSLLTSEEKKYIHKPKESKTWELQFLQPQSLKIRGSIRIQVFAEERLNNNRKRSLESTTTTNHAKRIKIDVENSDSENLEIDYTVLPVFAINGAVSIPLGILKLPVPLLQTNIGQNILHQRPLIKKEAIKMVAVNYGFVEEHLELHEEDMFFSVFSLSELGNNVFQKEPGAPLAVFDHPEYVEHHVDPEGRRYHLMEVRVILHRMMENYRQKLALQ